jgi:hypothetical protein
MMVAEETMASLSPAALMSAVSVAREALARWQAQPDPAARR